MSNNSPHITHSVVAKGDLIVLSAPSGSGKTSIIREVMKRMPELAFSISTTTRPPREGEKSGTDYHFVNRELFMERVEEGHFLEWAQVHNHLYGTPLADVNALRDKGMDLLLDLDVQGSQQIHKSCPDAVHILLLPPSLDIMKERLTNRLSDSEETIRTRILNAEGELEKIGHYDYVIINRVLNVAVADLHAIIHARRLRKERMAGEVAAIIDTFKESRRQK